MPSRILTYLVVGVLMAAAFIGISRWITAAIDEPVQEIIRQITRAEAPAPRIILAADAEQPLDGAGPKASYTQEEQARLIEIASSVGALKTCELENEFSAEQDIAGKAYARLAAIFEPYQDDSKTEMGALAETTLGVMASSGAARSVVRLSTQGGQTIVSGLEVVGPEACGSVAAFLQKQMDSGLLNFTPASKPGDEKAVGQDA